MDKKCIYYETCAILTGNAGVDESTLNNYKKIYCEAGRDMWGLCRRFQVREIVGRCPVEVLPDAPEDALEIIEKYDL